jgi:prepilin-type N-terminal cleavage/methylation domain-containing protein
MRLGTKKILLGFTLIEVLVVVSIIGILSSLIYVNFNQARNESKNRAWQTEMKEVQLAIELYKAQKGSYPTAESIPALSCGSVSSGVAEARSSDCLLNPVVENLVPEFINEFINPNTSNNSSCDLVYRVDAGEQSWYKLIAENCLVDVDASSGTQTTGEQARCPSSCSYCGEVENNSAYTESPAFYESLAVYSAGGQCE